MASSATPFGAEPVGTLSASGSFSGKVRHYPIATTYGTQISYGDFVLAVNDGTVAKCSITTAQVAQYLGVFVGCAYTDPTTNQKTFSQYWPASNAATDAVAYVMDDPFLLVKMQGDGTMAATTVFNNVQLNETAGSTAIGRSKNAIDASSAATTNTFPFRVIELIDNPEGNAFREAILMYVIGGATAEHRHLTGLGL